jgi:hypothetical protein
VAVSDYTPSWARDTGPVEETPEDEQYGGGLEFDHEPRETAGETRDADTDGPHGRTDRDRDYDDYTPTYEAWELERDPVPEDEQYGGGLEFDHEAAHTTEDDNEDDGDNAENDTEPEPDPETPAWVDDTRAVRDADLRDLHMIDDVCVECIDDPARASYQLVEPAHASAWYQLLDRHGFARALGEDERVWGGDGGLVVRAHGQSVDADADRFLSYLEVRGPAPAVRAFVEDLLDVVKYIKRELRAPALVEDADAAQEAGERVPDADRLVDRDRAAETVARLPGGEGR